MRNVHIVSAARSAVGKKHGTLANTHPTDILGPVQMEVVRRAGIASSAVGQVIGGCPDAVGAQAGNIIRTSWLTYGGAFEVAGATVDTACGSSQHALNLAAAMIASGKEDVVLACGVENMNIVPLAAPGPDGTKAGHGKPITRRYWEHYEFTSQFQGVERMAIKYGLTREQADALAVESQRRARRALDEGRFTEQIVPIAATLLDADGHKLDETALFQVDEVPRDTTIERLAQLTPVTQADGIHSAAACSQIADGAGALLLMSDDALQRYGLTSRARITETCLVGCDPVLMLEGPIPATQRMLQRRGLGIDDIDVFEVNEAFAGVILAWAQVVQPDMERVNPNGGAMALGHPLGGTGCILAVKALHELERADQERALVSMCCGGGLGTGTLIERG
ncbi:MAG TPA: acetyl-CoA C-acyltransferase [Ilumatobacteraceae bacterium]